MANVLEDRRIPLTVRMNLSNAALRYASALVNEDAQELDAARFDMQSYAEDMRICLRAVELGMDSDD